MVRSIDPGANCPIETAQASTAVRTSADLLSPVACETRFNSASWAGVKVTRHPTSPSGLRPGFPAPVISFMFRLSRFYCARRSKERVYKLAIGMHTRNAPRMHAHRNTRSLIALKLDA